ncbi:hypothetical protein BVRB_4g091480 [Beta vulgaris subsp. vulgaris]|nr:hypothetical protein BVRB_4g091480 [Beta vulgaris subsp. vulgaris]
MTVILAMILSVPACRAIKCRTETEICLEYGDYRCCEGLTCEPGTQNLPPGFAVCTPLGLPPQPPKENECQEMHDVCQPYEVVQVQEKPVRQESPVDPDGFQRALKPIRVRPVSVTSIHTGNAFSSLQDDQEEAGGRKEAGERPNPCARQDTHDTTAQSAYVVHTRPRQRSKATPHGEGAVKTKESAPLNHPTPSAKEAGPKTVQQMKDKETSEHAEGWISIPQKAKGKRTLRVAPSTIPNVPSSDENIASLSLSPTPIYMEKNQEGEAGDSVVAPSVLESCGKMSDQKLQLIIPDHDTDFIEA